MTLLLWLSSWSNISVLGVFLTAFAILVDFMKRRKKWSRYPPGPVSLPFVGTMPFINYSDPHHSFEKIVADTALSVAMQKQTTVKGQLEGVPRKQHKPLSSQALMKNSGMFSWRYIPALMRQIVFRAMILLSWQYRKKFGNIFSLQNCWTNVVVLNGYKTVKEALVNKSEDFADRPYFHIYEQLGYGQKSEGKSFADVHFLQAVAQGGLGR
ncbi:UNVERIFIED_CONTAM: hypothetical protein H355_001466 [Colinus virginianus]|nr:hypothetical protein H355_001466 [Colinus virginianus]